jgi:hypothetical protein
MENINVALVGHRDGALEIAASSSGQWDIAQPGREAHILPWCETG